MKYISKTIIIVAFGATLLSACGGQGSVNQENYYLPPTLVHIQPSPIPLRTETPIPPSPTAVCENNLSFLEDITIPDGTLVNPGQKFEKIWLVSNSGACNWQADYYVRFIDGVALDAEEIQPLFPSRSGGEAELRIIFTAPVQEGLYISAWQAHSPLGEPFGEVFFVQIVVDEDAQNNLPPVNPTNPISTEEISE